MTDLSPIEAVSERPIANELDVQLATDGGEATGQGKADVPGAARIEKHLTTPLQRNRPELVVHERGCSTRDDRRVVLRIPAPDRAGITRTGVHSIGFVSRTD